MLTDIGEVNRWDDNMSKDNIPPGPLSDKQSNAFDNDTFCPRCITYSLPKYYPGALGYWYTELKISGKVSPHLAWVFWKALSKLGVSGTIMYSNKGDELCSRCGDDEARQARNDQDNMSDDELILLGDWLVGDKDTQPDDWNNTRHYLPNIFVQKFIEGRKIYK